MSETKNCGQKVRRGSAALCSSIGAFIGGQLLGAMLIVWAVVTFFISNSLQTGNLGMMMLLGIVTFPFFVIPALLFDVLRD